MGNGGSFGQRDLSTASDTAGTLDDTDLDVWSANNTSATISFALGTSNYTITGDGGTTNLAGSYFNSGTLDRIELKAVGSKALWGIDNISVVAIPEPSSTCLLGLAGLACILRRRKI
ncbi:PEP-CTERM sorting domain-containing protein [Rubritalea tangerina]